jgi:hypothetical protein
MRWFWKATILVLGLTYRTADAGYFDCSVIYDEYEDLMANQFLVEPDRYVTTLPQQISRSDHEKLQRGIFQLHADRADRGIAVFRTNGNLHGKFLFKWTDPLPDQPPHVLIDYGVVYGRVADGDAPVFFVPLRLKPGAGVDLDVGRAMALDDGGPAVDDRSRQQLDIVYHIDDQIGEPILKAVNNASVYFPIESLCHRPQPGVESAPTR